MEVSEDSSVSDQAETQDLQKTTENKDATNEEVKSDIHESLNNTGVENDLDGEVLNTFLNFIQGKII